MFDIHLAYYRNIGPFQNKDVFVNYKNGKNLIKAPIGVGKSFLFFDAPIFALYKASSRTITNKNCKNSQVQLLFTVNDRHFLIVRDLTLTAKGKDSVKTKLYAIEDENALQEYLHLFDNQPIVQKKSDILTDMAFHNVKVEDMSGDFKTDAELQGSLNDFLPPKEVVLSTFFLMQDADNIFQTTPSERIQILKKIFGLIGIDEAKEVINEERKILVGQLRAKEDIESYQIKADEKIAKMKELQQSIGFPMEKLGFEDIGEDYKFDIDKLTSINLDLTDEKKELEKAKNLILSIEEKLNMYLENKVTKEKELEDNEKEIAELNKKNDEIKTFISSFDLGLEDRLKKEKTDIQDEIKTIKSSYEDINVSYEKYQSLQEKRRNLIEQKEDLGRKILGYKSNLEEFQKKIEIIENKIKEKSDVDVEQLNKQKMDLLSQKNAIASGIDFSSISLEGFDSPTNISSLERFILEVENTGKSYRTEIDKLKIENGELKIDLDSYTKELENKNKQLKASTEGLDDFFCNKINGNCPYVDEIRGGMMKKQQESLMGDIKQLEEYLNVRKERKDKKDEELKVLNEKRTQLLEVWKQHDFAALKAQIGDYHKFTNDIEKLDKKFVDLQDVQKLKDEIGNIGGQMKQVEGQIEDGNKQVEDLQKTVDGVVADMEKVGGEKLVADYRKLAEGNEKLEIINEKLDKFAESKEKLQKMQSEQNNLLYKIEDREKLRDKIKEEINKAQELANELRIKMEEQDVVALRKKEADISELEKTVALYNNIVDEFSANKLEVIDLRAKINRLKTLYDLFSKELVIIVFSDYLKQLEEILNNILSNLVDFTLLFEPDDKGVNLEIHAVDEKGTRLVQSLSGGQKNVIRLAWILAVSIFQNAKILFLDETVNNLDKDSIGKVAHYMQEFLEKNEMKFYMITHSAQLQGLDIWDDVEELGSIAS